MTDPRPVTYPLGLRIRHIAHTLTGQPLRWLYRDLAKEHNDNAVVLASIARFWRTLKWRPFEIQYESWEMQGVP